MYCTGGIRCERASAYLKQQGVEKVYQLEDGICKYMESYPGGGLWRGKNFVFDRRVAVGLNVAEPVVLSTCEFCATDWDTFHDERRFTPTHRTVTPTPSHCNLNPTHCNDPTVNRWGLGDAAGVEASC